MFHREYYINNCGHMDRWFELKCDRCGQIMCCSWPRVEDDDKDYCGECAFRLGIINPFEYCKDFVYYMGPLAYYAEVIDDNIHLFTKKQYEAKNRRKLRKLTDRRNSPEYKLFRTLVFKRDGYTCQHCNKLGGELNAHHIKSYAKHKDLRLDVDNGVTLCVNCHKKEHRRINGEAI